jgi:hypothetical protein
MGRARRLTLDDEIIHKRQIDLRVIGTNEIERAEVVRNGQVVHTFWGDDWAIEASWLDNTPLPMIALADAAGQGFVFYYVRVRQKDGHWAWGSPVWFDLPAMH